VDVVHLDLAPVVYSLEGEVHFGLALVDEVHFDSVPVVYSPEGEVHFDSVPVVYSPEGEVHFDSVPEVLYNFFLDLFCVDRSFLVSVNLSDLLTLQILVPLLYSY
jgi:hypothetical protein